MCKSMDVGKGMCVCVYIHVRIYTLQTGKKRLRTSKTAERNMKDAPPLGVNTTVPDAHERAQTE